MPRYAVTFSLTTGATTVHKPGCAQARWRKDRLVVIRIDHNADECAARIATDARLMEKRLEDPTVCACARLHDQLKRN